MKTSEEQASGRMRSRGGYWRNLSLFASVAIFIGATLAFGYQGFRGAMHYLHPPRIRPERDETPGVYGAEFDQVQLQTEDGLRLAAWFTPSRNGGLILVAHGYGAHRPAKVHALFARLDYGVLSWDFRAHGGSEGELCTFGYYEVRDFRAAVEFARGQSGVEAIGAWGGSMGGAISILAAAQIPEIEAVAVDSAYAALEDELEIMVDSPLLRPVIAFFGELQVGGGFDLVRPVDRVGEIAPRPVFIIQGLADRTIPTDSGSRLFAAAGQPRTLWQIEDVGHMAALDHMPEEYRDRLRAFFDRALLGD